MQTQDWYETDQFSTNELVRITCDESAPTRIYQGWLEKVERYDGSWWIEIRVGVGQSALIRLGSIEKIEVSE